MWYCGQGEERIAMPKDKRDDSFERKGGYASPRVPWTEMKPPPASASQSQPHVGNTSSGARLNEDPASN
jgi:hypothetical protein